MLTLAESCYYLLLYWAVTILYWSVKTMKPWKNKYNKIHKATDIKINLCENTFTSNSNEFSKSCIIVLPLQIYTKW